MLLLFYKHRINQIYDFYVIIYNVFQRSKLNMCIIVTRYIFVILINVYVLIIDVNTVL